MKNTFKLFALVLTLAMTLAVFALPASAEGKTYSTLGEEVPANLLEGTDAAIFNFGLYFQVKEAGTLKGIRRIFGAAESGTFNVCVYKQTTEVLDYVYQTTWTVDTASGAPVKWVDLALQDEVRLEPGINYCVTVECNESYANSYWVSEGAYSNYESDMFLCSEGSGRFAVESSIGEKTFPMNQGANGRSFMVDVVFLPDSEKPAPKTGSFTAAAAALSVFSLGGIVLASRKKSH